MPDGSFVDRQSEGRWFEANRYKTFIRRPTSLQSRHGENALIDAITYRRYDIARTLVTRRDIELDIVDERDRTPFIMATQYGSDTVPELKWPPSCSSRNFLFVQRTKYLGIEPIKVDTGTLQLQTFSKQTPMSSLVGYPI